MQHPEAVFLWLIFNNQHMDSHVCHVKSCPPPSVGFLDSTRQRRFAAHRNPICGGKHVPHQKTRCKNELIARPERITLRVYFVEQDARQKSAPTESFPRVWHGFLFYSLFTYVDAPNLGFVFSHVCSCTLRRLSASQQFLFSKQTLHRFFKYLCMRIHICLSRSG